MFPETPRQFLYQGSCDDKGTQADVGYQEYGFVYRVSPCGIKEIICPLINSGFHELAHRANTSEDCLCMRSEADSFSVPNLSWPPSLCLSESRSVLHSYWSNVF